MLVLFVRFKSHRGLAHSDQPLKDENVHISAPHIYGTIVESLDLKPGAAHSFLNIGSGTGYLSCIVSQVLGKDAYMYGVEIYPDVIEHGNASIKRWTDARIADNSNVPFVEPSMEFVHGNGLEIDPNTGESSFGFDRIYIGASVSQEHLTKVANLLRPGGVLVAPGMSENCCC
jgi:protein-L-isoaspartate O-methyltransferase